MELFNKYIQGHDNLYILIAQIVFVGLISNYVTYKLAFEYQLTAYQMLGVVAVFTMLLNYLVNYITPLKFIQDILEDMKRVHVFGIAIFGASNLFIGMYVLYKYYGLLPTLGISFGAPALAALSIVALDKIIEDTTKE
jgi:ABC-type transporter Mla maintaining outer membrane lipid asymmetry permease subunit MlaE